MHILVEGLVVNFKNVLSIDDFPNAALDGRYRVIKAVRQKLCFIT